MGQKRRKILDFLIVHLLLASYVDSVSALKDYEFVHYVFMLYGTMRVLR